MDKDLRRLEGNVGYPGIPFSFEIVADTQESVAPIVASGYVVIKAAIGNTGNVLVGVGTLVVNVAGALEPGDTIGFEVGDLSLIQALNVVAGDILYVFGAYKS